MTDPSLTRNETPPGAGSFARAGRCLLLTIASISLALPLAAAAPAAGSDAGPGYASPPSFRQDIVPLLTKAGCNAGGCHGKMAGQNGFKLSLRGYAPEMDFESLTSDVSSRRIDFSAPEQSLLVTKPLGLVPHEGGRRIAEGSRGHRLLLDWIAARAPGPAPDTSESDATGLEVLPGSRTMRVGDIQQLQVRAHYPNGRVRDVTWLSQFVSNDEAIVSVTPDGLAKSLRSGEGSVRVHFQGQVAVVTFTTPYGHKVDPQAYAAKNNVVDEHVFARLAALEIPPSPAAGDATFVRRVFLDILGALPTPEEAKAFVDDKSENKRARLIDDLLGRPEFIDYWTLQLADLLQNRKERDQDVRGTKNVRLMHAWLREQVAKNRPWNELAKDVLTATGDALSKPQIGYYVVTMGGKSQVEESEVADSVAQSFLGARIGCARCHNHPLEKYTQDDYYHFAAFFSKVSLDRKDVGKGTTALLTQTRDERQQQREIERIEKQLAEAESAAKDKSGDALKKAEEKVREQKKQLEGARKRLEEMRSKPPTVRQPRTNRQLAPQPLDRAKLDLSPGQDPREALAAWVTDPKNEQFAGAMVNRLWKHFMAVGMVEPVDDIRSSNPPSNPALWKALSAEFISHGYDLKHVMRLITNSRAYQLSSETLKENETDRRFHSRYYARRLPAEVMLDAVSGATGVPDTFPGYPVGLRAVQLPEPGVGSYFLTLFGRSDRVTACACERSGDVTLPQLLHLSNSADVHNKIRSGEGRLAALLKEHSEDRPAIEQVFLATVSRAPTEKELAAVTEALEAGDPREEVYRDLMWALLNAKEFAFNH